MKRSIVSIAIVSLAAGCGGGGSVPIDDLDDEVAESFCDRLVRCGSFEDLGTCLEIFGAAGAADFDDIRAGVDNGTIDYDGGKAAECLNALADQECSQAGAREEPEACREVISGNLGEGEDCVLDEQCESQNCVGACEEECCTGACGATLELAEIGESCVDVGCVAGAFCQDGTCAALLGQGEGCSSDAQCQAGLLCTFGEVPTCEEPPGVGDPCLGGEACPTEGLRCDFSSGNCAEVLHEGDACDPQNDLCSFYYVYCEPETSQCTRYPGVGEECPRFFCSGGAWCDFDIQAGTSECRAPLANGEACDGDIQCQSGYCDANATCAEPVTCI